MSDAEEKQKQNLEVIVDFHSEDSLNVLAAWTPKVLVTGITDRC